MRGMSGQPIHASLPLPRNSDPSSGSRYSGTGVTLTNSDQPPLSNGCRLRAALQHRAPVHRLIVDRHADARQLIRHHQRGRVVERLIGGVQQHQPLAMIPGILQHRLHLGRAAAFGERLDPRHVHFGFAGRQITHRHDGALRIAAHDRVHHRALIDRRQDRAPQLHVVGRRNDMVGSQLADEAPLVQPPGHHVRRPLQASAAGPASAFPASRPRRSPARSPRWRDRESSSTPRDRPARDARPTVKLAGSSRGT